MVKYIIIEGIDKSGKTTLINDPKIQEVLKEKGYEVMYLPHGWFRKIIKPLQKIIGFENPVIKWLYDKYHYYLFNKFSKLAAEDKNLITDRSFLSMVVYQHKEIFENDDKLSKELFVSIANVFIYYGLKNLGFDEVHIVYLYPVDKVSDLSPIRKELHKRYMTLLKALSNELKYVTEPKIKIHVLRTRDRDKRVKTLLELL